MRPLVIVVVKPLIQVRLEHLHRGIELLSEGLPEELVEDRPVEPLHEAVGPGPGHLGSTMLDLAELQKDLEGVDHRPPAVLSAVVRQDMLDRQPLGLVKGQYTVIQDIDGRLQLRRVELPKGKGTIGIDDGLHVNPADPLQGAHQERVLAKQVARVEALDLALPEAGVGLLEERICSAVSSTSWPFFSSSRRRSRLYLVSMPSLSQRLRTVLGLTEMPSRRS